MLLVFDIGGTKTRLAVSEDGKTLLGEPAVLPTAQEWNTAEEQITEAIKKFGTIDRVCGGLPGVLDSKHETLTRAPHLQSWIGKPIKKLFARAAGTDDVQLFNDTVLAGLGEATEGAGKGQGIVAYLTVSTGVGGARIEGGVPNQTHTGFEPGHQIIEATRKLTLEDLVSGSAFAKRFGQDFVQKTPAEAWDEAAFFLAAGVYNTILHWSPDVVVLGGSMMIKTPGIAVAAVEKHLHEMKSVFPELPPLRKAALGDYGGLVGALAALRATT